MTVNFRQLLSQPTDSVERPKALPKTFFRGEILGHEIGTSRQKQTPYVRFMLKPEEAHEPDDDVIEALKGIDLSRRELRRDFYITPGAIYRLSDMLDAVLGPQQGRSFDERIPETRGAKVIFGVVQRQSEDGQETYNDVTSIIAA